MYKIVLINHAFAKTFLQRRWVLFAEKHQDFDVTLIAPGQWTWGTNRHYTYGEKKTRELERIDKGNFHVRPISVQTHKYWGWTSKELLNVLYEIKPDLIYHIGNHLQPSLMQCYDYARKYDNKCKVAAFSMRGPVSNVFFKGPYSFPKFLGKIAISWPNLIKTNKHCDAILCHYPEAVNCFREEGYKGPIYMCTQVGVNVEDYHPDSKSRDFIREKYNIGDSFLFGSASRFASDKGIDDILDALPKDGNWMYMMMGSGSENEVSHIKNHIKQLGFEDRVIMPGYVDQSEMPAYWNAVDCAVHVPRSHKTSMWVETFSLAIVQAMATRKPIIGNTSGSVPYQIGPDGIIVKEGDIDALSEKMSWAMTHPSEADEIAEKMEWRAVHCFDIKHLNDCIYEIFIDIIKGKYDESKIDMTSFNVPERDEISKTV